MSEHNYPAPRPEESPGDDEARGPETPFLTPEDEYHAKSLRYRQEALQLYFMDVQENADTASAERLTPFTESWLAFETSYEGSFESKIDFVDHVMDDLGWFRILHKMATQMGIPAGALRLDYADVYDYFSRYFQIFHTDEEVLHVFARRGVKPMAPDLTPRRGTA